MENVKMTPRERIEELEGEFIHELDARGMVNAMQQAMNQMDFWKETDKEKVKTIEEALCAIAILDSIKVDEKLKASFDDYATALGVQTIVEQLNIHKQDLSGLPPELQAILDLFPKRI